MTTKPDISVIVPTFDREDLLPYCLDSLLSQTFPAAQIIVVDDGSRDSTPYLLREFGSDITVLRKQNGGKASAVNRGLEAAEGDLVWILDDDDVALPDALERLAEPLTESDSIGFSYGAKYFCRSEPDGSIGRVVGMSSVPEAYDSSFAASLMLNNFLGGAAVMVRRSVYRDIGGYDESLARSQDYEMAIRIALRYRGARIRGGPTYCHRNHDGVRGTLAERFSASRRVEMWAKFNEVIMRRLYSELPIGVYAPYAEREGAPELAILGRVRTMAAHGVHDLALRDLRQLGLTRFRGGISSEAFSVGREAVYRFVASGGDVGDLSSVLAVSSPSVDRLFRSMRLHLVTAMVRRFVPRAVPRTLRSIKSRGRRFVEGHINSLKVLLSRAIPAGVARAVVPDPVERRSRRPGNTGLPPLVLYSNAIEGPGSPVSGRMVAGDLASKT